MRFRLTLFLSLIVLWLVVVSGLRAESGSFSVGGVSGEWEVYLDSAEGVVHWRVLPSGGTGAEHGVDGYSSEVFSSYLGDNYPYETGEWDSAPLSSIGNPAYVRLFLNVPGFTPGSGEEGTTNFPLITPYLQVSSLDGYSPGVGADALGVVRVAGATLAMLSLVGLSSIGARWLWSLFVRVASADEQRGE